MRKLVFIEQAFKWTNLANVLLTVECVFSIPVTIIYEFWFEFSKSLVVRFPQTGFPDKFPIKIPDDIFLTCQVRNKDLAKVLGIIAPGEAVCWDVLYKLFSFR